MAGKGKDASPRKGNERMLTGLTFGPSCLCRLVPYFLARREWPHWHQAGLRRGRLWGLHRHALKLGGREGAAQVGKCVPVPTVRGGGHAGCDRGRCAYMESFAGLGCAAQAPSELRARDLAATRTVAAITSYRINEPFQDGPGEGFAHVREQRQVTHHVRHPPSSLAPQPRPRHSNASPHSIPRPAHPQAWATLAMACIRCSRSWRLCTAASAASARPASSCPCTRCFAPAPSRPARTTSRTRWAETCGGSQRIWVCVLKGASGGGGGDGGAGASNGKG